MIVSLVSFFASFAQPQPPPIGNALGCGTGQLTEAAMMALQTDTPVDNNHAVVRFLEDT